MNSQNNGGFGKWLARHPFVVGLGIVSGVIAIFVFVPGFQSIPDILDSWRNPGFIRIPFAENDGGVWQAAFYNKANPKRVPLVQA